MSQETSIELFENAKIRVVWDDEEEKYYFSVVDVIQVLTESSVAKRYWTDLKRRLKEEGADEVYAKIVQLKMPAADGKNYLTDAADLEQILRIIQSIPSKKAEPMKRWLAQVGSERIQQMIDPERSIDQAIKDYQRLGYSENWINQRVKTIEVRKGLTDEWKRAGLQEGLIIPNSVQLEIWRGVTISCCQLKHGLTAPCSKKG